jgi:PIN domain nuclease of toxin-antitoxin system
MPGTLWPSEASARYSRILPAHPDPADRFLVATALTYDLTLVTADQVLLDAKACPTLAAA